MVHSSPVLPRRTISPGSSTRFAGIEYVHLPNLAPTGELLSDYRKKRIDWNTYEVRFLDLMHRRRIEETLSREVLDEGCLLCSEDQPHHCHRRLVAEYLDEHWGGVEIKHLGMEETRYGHRMKRQPGIRVPSGGGSAGAPDGAARRGAGPACEDPRAPVHSERPDERVNRDFQVSRPNALWVSDPRFHHSGAGSMWRHGGGSPARPSHRRLCAAPHPLPRAQAFARRAGVEFTAHGRALRCPRTSPSRAPCAP